MRLTIARPRPLPLSSRVFHEGRGLAFPCDATGHVNLDALTERARCNYFFARSVVGRDFAAPAVLPTLH
jgi:hypothetical protein